MENDNHLGLQNTQKNVMDNSPGCIRKQYAFHEYIQERNIREALEIYKLRTINEKDKTFTPWNRDNGDYLMKNSWKLLFVKMENH